MKNSPPRIRPLSRTCGRPSIRKRYVFRIGLSHARGRGLPHREAPVRKRAFPAFTEGAFPQADARDALCVAHDLTAKGLPAGGHGDSTSPFPTLVGRILVVPSSDKALLRSSPRLPDIPPGTFRHGAEPFPPPRIGQLPHAPGAGQGIRPINPEYKYFFTRLLPSGPENSLLLRVKMRYAQKMGQKAFQRPFLRLFPYEKHSRFPTESTLSSGGPAS